MESTKTANYPFRLDVPKLMEQHGVSVRALARRLGVSRHKAEKIIRHEWFSREQHRALWTAIAGVQFNADDTTATATANDKYTVLDISNDAGEVKTYRCYPHHTKDEFVWALWQGKGVKTYYVRRNRRGIPRHVTCTCPDAARRNGPNGEGGLCKHAKALITCGMVI